MKTWTVSSSRPEQCVKAGSAIVTAAKKLDVKSIHTQLAIFAKAQDGLVSAAEVLAKAERDHAEARTNVEEFGKELNGGVKAVAGALMMEGEVGQNPFASLRQPTPAKIGQQKIGRRLDSVKHLARVIRARSGMSKTLHDVVAEVEKLAARGDGLVETLQEKESAKNAASTDAKVAARHWEKAFQALRHTAKASDKLDGGTLYEQLFRVTAPVVTRHGGTPAPEAPVVEPVVDPAPAVS